MTFASAVRAIHVALAVDGDDALAQCLVAIREQDLTREGALAIGL
jgi:hypothetical protein